MTLSARISILDFRFWILGCRSKNPKVESKMFCPCFFFLNRKSKIGNRKSFYDLVGSRQDVRRNRDSDLLRGFQIDDEIELGRLLNRQIGGLSTL